MLTKPTQPPILSGMKNEYRSKGNDAGHYDSFQLRIDVRVTGSKTVCDPLLTSATLECPRDEQITINH